MRLVWGLQLMLVLQHKGMSTYLERGAVEQWCFLRVLMGARGLSFGNGILVS